MNIAVWLRRAGLGYGLLPAIMRGQTVVRDYAGFAMRAAQLAATLRGRFGLSAGDRVAIVAKNSADYLETLYGIWWAGLAAVPVNAKLHGAEIGWILENSGSRVAFASVGLDAEIAQHRPDTLEALVPIGGPDYEALFGDDQLPLAECGPDDLAWLFYTSGTTGRPKGAMLTHRNLTAMSFAYMSDVDPTMPGETLLHAAPMSHGSGLYIMAHVGRFAVNAVAESGGFEPSEILDFFTKRPGTSMFAAPTMIKRLVESPHTVPDGHIRTIIWGGAPMHTADTLRALDRFGPCFAQIYGQGETPMTTTVLPKWAIADRKHPRWMERLGSAGLVNSAVEVRIADGDDVTLATGEIGEVLVRGDTVIPGYWNNPDATESALRGGWLHTGDVGAFDDDGFLTLKDRSKDLIISGGTNIYPREVEEVLLKHPNVREVSVIGRPDPEWGEVVVAYVVGDTQAMELDALCLSEIARFKRPKDYVFVDALPKNNYGKILKTELRDIDNSRKG
ncbi:MAG: AMP-dependent synthetase [Hyphomicrobiales bacterium]|nr:MAG: AMP-dependent synthetase [Hyphomicrobiales bacterium]